MFIPDLIISIDLVSSNIAGNVGNKKRGGKFMPPSSLLLSCCVFVHTSVVETNFVVVLQF